MILNTGRCFRDLLAHSREPPAWTPSRAGSACHQKLHMIQPTGHCLYEELCYLSKPGCLVVIYVRLYLPAWRVAISINAAPGNIWEHRRYRNRAWAVWKYLRQAPHPPKNLGRLDLFSAETHSRLKVALPRSRCRFPVMLICALTDVTLLGS